MSKDVIESLQVSHNIFVWGLEVIWQMFKAAKIQTNSRHDQFS